MVGVDHAWDASDVVDSHTNLARIVADIGA